MALTPTQTTEAYQFFIVAFGAAPGVEYMNQLSDAYEAGMTTQEIVNVYTTKPQFEAQYPRFLTSEQFADKLVENVVGASASAAAKTEAKAEVVAALNHGLSKGDVIFNIFNNLANKPTTDALWGTTAQMFDNKVEVAQYATETLLIDTTDLAQLRGLVSSVTADAASVDAAKTAAAGGSNSQNFTLTQQADSLTGNAGDNVFFAPVTQNTTGSGALANTFETGDVLNGGAGTDTLNATLIATGTIQDNFNGVAISATTTSIENVFLRAQAIQNDDGASNTTFSATIDAGNMAGVQQWWSADSRADVRVEDVRSRPDDVTIGMRLTDPRVSYDLYFNPLFMVSGENAESTLTLTLQEITGGVVRNELANITVREINFTLDGVGYSLDTAAIRAANTWEALEAAVAEALAAVPALAELTVNHTGNGVFEIVDGAGGTFEIVDGEALILGNAADIDVRNRVEVGRVTEEQLISTDIVLDGVGNGSRGGSLNVAAMSGDRGVEVFNVFVDRDSHLSALSSENNPRNTGSFSQEQMLQEVYVSHLAGGRMGDLQIGTRTVDNFGVSTTTDDRLNNDGLFDVRVFDATGFAGFMKVGASITAASFDNYLARVTADDAEPGQFHYLMGNGGSNLSLDVVNAVASDVDFSLEYVGGTGDDRLNLSTVADKSNISVDGGAGNNTIELTASTQAATAFDSFENFQTLVIAGAGGSTQNLVRGNMLGLDTVIVATTGGNTTVEQMAFDQELVISGKNQTLGAGNNNNDQDFGTVTVRNTTAVAGDTAFDITLDNTARVDGVLTVDQLVIDGADNDITTLNLESAGRRDTANVVARFDGADVTRLNLVGSQDLAIDVNTIAAGAAVDAVVNGAALTGDLVLAVNGNELDGGADDELIGTAGTRDLLALYGGVTTNTEVSAFETVQFGWLNGGSLDAVFTAPRTAAGTFDAGNTSGVNTYIVGNVGVATAFGIESLRSGNVVQLGDATIAAATQQAIYSGATLDLTFTGAGTAAQGNLTINALSRVDDAQFGMGEVTVNVNNFTNVAMSFDRGLATAAENLFFTAVLDDDARTLTLTGGNANEDISLTQEGGLNTSLTRIDISGFQGEVDLGVWDSLQGTNATIVVNSYNFTFDVGGNNAVVAVAPGAANTYEVNTVDYSAAANELDVGASITITFAGSSYTFTNTTAAAINAANLNAAIIADATNAPAGFSIADNGAGLIQLTATTFGNLTAAGLNPVVTTTDVNLGAAAVLNATVGDTSSVTGFDMVTVAPEFITSFDFNVDANDVGVVWQIDNFYAFEAGANVGLNNQSIIDLRDLGVNSATDIVVEDAAAFWAGLTAAQQADFNAVYGGNFAASFGAGDTVISSNEGLNFTIVLTGVAVADVVNENIAGIA
ncbi:MAG: beta strand repeat-containing protein [Burkholderiaceae bacterium]